MKHKSLKPKKRLKVFAQKTAHVILVASIVLMWVFSATIQIGPFPAPPNEAQAAFSSVTARGSNVRTSSGATIAVSPTANLTVGKIVFVSVVTDNIATADGPSTNHDTLEDTDGNTWTEVFEETDSAGSAADGSTTSLWWAYVNTQIDTSDSITITVDSNFTDGIISIVEVTVAAGKTVTAIPSAAIDHADSGSSISDTQASLTNREYLFFGLFGAEGEDTTKGAIANYAEQHDLISTGSGLAANNVQMHVGTRILTGQGDTWTSTADFTNGIQSLTAFYETDITTSLADGTDPGNSTIAPSASVTDLDAFTFQTSAGTDNITAVTVTLAPAGAFNNISKVEVTDNSNVDECTDIDDPSGLTLNFTGCSLAVTSSATTFKVRVTPKTHANMAAPSSGVSYAVTGTVTGWTGTNTAHAGTDTDSATITIDNDSPADVTSASVSAGDEENSLAWTNPGDSDLANIIVLQATSTVADTPVEGSTYATSTWIGAAQVACSGLVTSCTATSLTNGTTYYYEIFTRDSNGNWAPSGTVPTGSPATPAGSTLTQASYRLYTPSDGTSWTERVAAEANRWMGVAYGNGLFVAVSDSGTNRVMTSPNGITWTERSAAEANSWVAVTYGNGLFVAVSEDGTNRVMTSSDGITWSPQSAVSSLWTSVTYGNGLFVAVADSGTNRVMTSSDGITWSPRSAAEANSWQSVTYGGGLFVAVAWDGTNRVMTSSDGITWSPQSAAEESAWNGVTHGDGLFVAVSCGASTTPCNTTSGGRIMSSTDGVNWTVRLTDTTRLHSIAYGNGLFVAIGTGQTDTIKTSSDGITWASYSAPVSNSWTEVIYGNGAFVGISWTTSNNQVMTSGEIGGTVLANQDTAGTLTSSGQAFRLRTRIAVDDASSPINRRRLKLQYAQKSGTCDASFTGETYADVSESTPIAFFDDVGASSTTTPASGNEVTNGGRDLVYQTYEEANNFTNSNAAIPVGDDGLWDISLYDNGMSGSYCMRHVNSTDAYSWTEQSASEASTWSAVTYGEGLFVAVATSGTNLVMTSPDGAEWTSRTGVSTVWRDVVYGGGQFVAVGSTGANRVMTSPDGIAWDGQTAAAANEWFDVAYGNGLFVAASGTGFGTINDRIMTSPDGVAWTSRTAAENVQWSIAYGNGLFVAVAGSATTGVMTSTDGITWTSRDQAVDKAWGAIAFGEGLFVAIAPDGIMVSSDGINWTEKTLSDDLTGGSIVYGNGLFVAHSSGGDFVTSSDGNTWTLRDSAADGLWSELAFGNGVYTAVASTGTDQVITSSTSAAVLDTYSVVPEVSSAAASPALHQLHYILRKDNVSESSTTFTGTQDTQLNTSSIQVGDKVRVRLLLSNSGQGAATSYTYQLEYSSGACSSWSAVPNAESTDPWVAEFSSRINNGDATTNNTGLTDPGGLDFVAGLVVAGTNSTSAYTLDTSKFTELEYVVRSTDTVVTGTTYCFRVTNAGLTTNFTYDQTPSIVLPANAVRPQSGGSSSAVEAPAPPSAPVTGGDEGGSDGGTGEGGGGGAPEGGGNEGGGGGGDLGTVTRNLASILNNIKSLLLRLR